MDAFVTTLTVFSPNMFNFYILNFISMYMFYDSETYY